MENDLFFYIVLNLEVSYGLYILRENISEPLVRRNLSKMTIHSLYNNDMITEEIQNYCNPGMRSNLQLPSPNIGCDRGVRAETK